MLKTALGIVNCFPHLCSKLFTRPMSLFVGVQSVGLVQIHPGRIFSQTKPKPATHFLQSAYSFGNAAPAFCLPTKHHRPASGKQAHEKRIQTAQLQAARGESGAWASGWQKDVALALHASFRGACLATLPSRPT